MRWVSDIQYRPGTSFVSSEDVPSEVIFIDDFLLRAVLTVMLILDNEMTTKSEMIGEGF